MSEHTKGPWRLYPVASRTQLWRTIQSGNGRRNLAKVIMSQSTEREGLDNARLMTAAPELLEALERIRDGAGSNPGFTACGCEDHNSSDCCNCAGYCCPECIASAAIAKVEGK